MFKLILAHVPVSEVLMLIFLFPLFNFLYSFLCLKRGVYTMHRSTILCLLFYPLIIFIIFYRYPIDLGGLNAFYCMEKKLRTDNPCFLFMVAVGSSPCYLIVFNEMLHNSTLRCLSSLISSALIDFLTFRFSFELARLSY